MENELACRTCAASRRSSTLTHSCVCGIQKIQGDKEFLSFISGKMEWESPPCILVTRNPNWSQRSGTETSCVKGRYQHLKYALPNVSCIVLLSDKNLWSHHVGPSMVQEKPSLIRRFLSYGVKPNRSNVYKRTIVLISGIRFTCKFVIMDIKRKQNNFFGFF